MYGRFVVPSTARRGPVAAGRSQPEQMLGRKVIAKTCADGSVAEPIAAFDVTFSPSKSVWLRWGLTDNQKVRRIVVEAHETAVAAGLAYLDEAAGHTRDMADVAALRAARADLGVSVLQLWVTDFGCGGNRNADQLANYWPATVTAPILWTMTSSSKRSTTCTSTVVSIDHPLPTASAEDPSTGESVSRGDMASTSVYAGDAFNSQGDQCSSNVWSDRCLTCVKRSGCSSRKPVHDLASSLAARSTSPPSTRCATISRSSSNRVAATSTSTWPPSPSATQPSCASSLPPARTFTPAVATSTSSTRHRRRPACCNSPVSTPPRSPLHIAYRSTVRSFRRERVEFRKRRSLPTDEARKEPTVPIDRRITGDSGDVTLRRAATNGERHVAVPPLQVWRAGLGRLVRWKVLARFRRSAGEVLDDGTCAIETDRWHQDREANAGSAVDGEPLETFSAPPIRHTASRRRSDSAAPPAPFIICSASWG